MDIAEQLDCRCGNPDCKGRLSIRQGYVSISHPDGPEEERWDWLHVEAYKSDDKGGVIMTGLMFAPKDAKAMMWGFIWAYMPILHWLRDSFFRIRCRCVDLFYRLRERNRPNT